MRNQLGCTFKEIPFIFNNSTPSKPHPPKNKKDVQELFQSYKGNSSLSLTMRAQASTAVKICGITQVNQALEIASLGVEAIGVIGVKSSPRFLPEIQRRELFKKLIKFYPTLERVWVVANLNTNQILKGINGTGAPSIVQLHGHESKQLCKEIKASHPHIKLWKSFQIHEHNDLLLTKEYEDLVDAILLDAWSASSLGGTGKRIPLNLLSQFNCKIPWWLAGGISSDHIEEILSKTKPFGIDASSKLEIEPGIKNIEKVKALLDTLKQ